MIGKSIGIALFLFVVVSLKAGAQMHMGVKPGHSDSGANNTSIEVSYDYGCGSLRNALSAKISHEVIRRKAVTISANARYRSVDVHFAEAEISDGYGMEADRLNGTHAIGQAGLTSFFRARAFGKPFMGMAMLNAEWGQGGFARISGIAMGLFMLRADKDTQFGLGPLVMINSTSKVPVFPIFVYRHRFNAKWLINLYGNIFSLDYMPSDRDLLSVGADIDVKSFYFTPRSPGLPERCRFTSTSFRPMARYRRQLASNISFDVEGGVALKMSCRVNGVTGTMEYFDCRRKPSPFLQTSLSCSF